GEIQVLEIRTYHAVTPDVAQGACRRDQEDSGWGSKPLCWVTGYYHWTVGIGPDRGAHSGDRCSCQDHIEGVAALQAQNWRKRLSTHQSVPFEGQVVDSVYHKALPGIEVRRSPAAKDVRVVLDDNTVVVAGSLIEGVRPGVGCVELQAFAHALVS